MATICQSYLTLCFLQNVKSLSLHSELHQMALVRQKTHRQALVLLSHTFLFGSLEATVNSDFINTYLSLRSLSFAHVEIE